ncbi:MAG: hypothetical protein JEZ10_01865 [Verrucomicrobia bacterium]|nr:hypothetical protein [Verrucomicrobiota bacterium]
MKSRLQFTPALTVALVCALAWFALWLTAFRPMPERPAKSKPRPAAAFCPSADRTLHALQAPTLFALPSEEGFSGIFPERRVNVNLSLELPRQPETYLSRQPGAAPAPDQTQLIERIPLPQNKLPAPGAGRTTVLRQPEPIALFFSPELQPRATEIKSLSGVETLSVASVRIRLTVRPDGNVAHAFFEDPMENAALLSAIRRLRFNPAPEESTGWLDIRFSPSTGKEGDAL